MNQNSCWNCTWTRPRRRARAQEIPGCPRGKEITDRPRDKGYKSDVSLFRLEGLRATWGTFPLFPHVGEIEHSIKKEQISRVVR